MKLLLTVTALIMLSGCGSITHSQMNAMVEFCADKEGVWKLHVSAGSLDAAVTCKDGTRIRYDAL